MKPMSWLFVFLTVLAVNTAYPQEVPNGSFEDGLVGWDTGDDQRGISIHKQSPSTSRAKHGEHFLVLDPSARPARPFASHSFVGINSATFPPIPPAHFSALRIGVWVATDSGRHLIGPEDRLSYGIDTLDCAGGVLGTEIDQSWRHASCEERDSTQYVTDSSWKIWVTALARPADQPGDTMVWHIDAVSVELCLN